MIGLALLSVILCIISLLWFLLHVHEFWKTKNAWNFASILIFLAASVVIASGLAILYRSQQVSEYDFWKFALCVSIGVALILLGACVRFALKLSNRVGLAEKRRGHK